MKTKKEKTIRNFLCGVFSLAILGLAVNCPKLDAKAEDTIEVQLPGKTWYNVAKRMVEDINAKRKANGVGELVLDEDLQEWATQVSAEMMFYSNAITSAYKADGGYLYSIVTKPLGGIFEHLVVYSGETADDVFNNTAGMYNIRFRMLLTDPSYKSIGIGLFQETFSANKFIYAVILVENDNIKQGAYKPDTNETRNVKTLIENYKLCNASDENSAVEFNPDKIKLECGKSKTVQITQHRSDGIHIPINNIQAIWTSSNPAVALVDNQGTITGLSEGTCTVTAALYGQTTSYSVTVTDNSQKEETAKKPEVNSLKDLPKDYQGLAVVDGEEVYVKNQKKYSGACELDGQTYYYENGVKFSGAKGKYYYKSGLKYTGWRKESGKKYYYDNGKMVRNRFKTIKKKKYYFNKKGIMQVGQVKVKGKYYYFNKSGVMQKNKWVKIGKHKYYFNKKGIRTKKK